MEFYDPVNIERTLWRWDFQSNYKHWYQ